MLVSSMTHGIWLTDYDSLCMNQYDSYLYFSRYSDGYHLAMVAIYFDRLGAKSGFQKIQPYSYHQRLVLIFHKIFNHVADDLNKSVFLKTNNSQAKLTNSISSVFSFWQIRLKMTLDLRLVTYHFFPKYSLMPLTRKNFWISSLAQK